MVHQYQARRQWGGCSGVMVKGNVGKCRRLTISGTVLVIRRVHILHARILSNGDSRVYSDQPVLVPLVPTWDSHCRCLGGSDTGGTCRVWANYTDGQRVRPMSGSRCSACDVPFLGISVLFRAKGPRRRGGMRQRAGNRGTCMHSAWRYSGTVALPTH